MARIDPLRNFRYRLKIDGITQAGFSEVIIAETTIDAVDYRGPDEIRKQASSVWHKNGAAS